MRVLLDTHAFLWLDAEPQKLSAAATQAFQDSGNEMYLSIASVWEMQIKAQLGRGLTLRLPLPELVRAASCQWNSTAAFGAGTYLRLAKPAAGAWRPF